VPGAVPGGFHQQPPGRQRPSGAPPAFQHGEGVVAVRVTGEPHPGPGEVNLAQAGSEVLLGADSAGVLKFPGL
jgi:hypothetical protein